jgi:hypothetical protein
VASAAGLAPALTDPLATLLVRASVQRALAAVRPADPARALRALAGAALEPDAAPALPLAMRVTGQPVVDRATATTVARAHHHGTLHALLAVVLVLLVAARTRRPFAALAAGAGLYAAAGFLGVPLGVGSTLLPATVIAAGLTLDLLGPAVGLSALGLAAFFAPLAAAQTPALAALGVLAIAALVPAAFVYGWRPWSS